jgi:hypothetical protein
MKRPSSVGGGKFEFDPFDLDRKINKREKYFEKDA